MNEFDTIGDLINAVADITSENSLQDTYEAFGFTAPSVTLLAAESEPESDVVVDDYLPDEINDAEDIQAVVDYAVKSALSAGSDNAAASVSESDFSTLAEINASVQSLASNVYVFSPTSTQAEYFESVLVGSPFKDYYAIQDNDYSYYLYYGYKLSANSSCDIIHIYRTSSGSYNYYWNVDKSTGRCPTMNFDGYCYSNLSSSAGVFSDVTVAKNQTIICIGLVTALGLWGFSRILFR